VFNMQSVRDFFRRFDVSYCVPVFQSFWICVSGLLLHSLLTTFDFKTMLLVVSGMIFYHEYVGMSADQVSSSFSYYYYYFF